MELWNVVEVTRKPKSKKLDTRIAYTYADDQDAAKEHANRLGPTFDVQLGNLESDYNTFYAKLPLNK